MITFSFFFLIALCSLAVFLVLRRGGADGADDFAGFAPDHRWLRSGKLKILGLMVAVVFYAGGALAAGDAAKPADADLLKQLAIHAAGIAIFIRAGIALLRSPFLFLVWGKVPAPARVAVLMLLGALAAAFDHIALGTPPFEALSGAVIGLFGVVGGHEMGKRVVPRKPKPAAR